MRWTSMGATGSELRLDYVSARNWIIYALSALLLGYADEAAAQWQREVRFSSHDDSLLSTGGGPYSPTRAPIDPGRAGPGPAGPGPAPSASIPESSSGFNGTEYWDALADLNLASLRGAAASDVQSGFAHGMSLLADGDTEGAEKAFVDGSEQRSDANIGIASRIMLAATLLYEHKWAELQNLSLSSHLSAADQAIVRDYQKWGFAFANIEPQRVLLSADSMQMPLHITPIGTPTIRVRINGKQYEFWLDTGSSITVINSDVAREVGVPIVSDDKLSVRTFSGSAPVRAALIRRMEIGALLLENTAAVVVEASHMSLRSAPDRVQSTRMHIDGIIGWDTIRQLDLLLDYTRGVIVIRRPQRTENSPHNLTWMGKPFVEVQTKRGETLHFTLDTGAQSSFLNAIALDKTGASSTLAEGVVFGIAGTGNRADKVIRTLPLQLGGKSVQLNGVMVYGPVYSGMINCDGILGSDIARYGTIRIDATNGVFAIGLNPLRGSD
ncbi:MAG TPA: aspartyl protease family protein [Gemmatimonadaceae bacterium]|nr:aspartyl protease family protein [Gemmatimonadaceae bacterium]